MSSRRLSNFRKSWTVLLNKIKIAADESFQGKLPPNPTRFQIQGLRRTWGFALRRAGGRFGPSELLRRRASFNPHYRCVPCLPGSANRVGRDD